MSLSLLRHLGGINQRPRPLAFAAGSMCCSRRPRRESEAEWTCGVSQRMLPRSQIEGGYARQGRCRAAPAGPSLHNADRRIRSWSEGQRSALSGSRRAATGVRNDRGARPQSVEDHDRWFCHGGLLTWGFSRLSPVLNTTQFHLRRPGTDLARSKPAVQSPSHRPARDRRRSRIPPRSRGDVLQRCCPSRINQCSKVGITVCLGRTGHLRNEDRWPRHPMASRSAGRARALARRSVTALASHAPDARHRGLGLTGTPVGRPARRHRGAGEGGGT